MPDDRDQALSASLHAATPAPVPGQDGHDLAAAPLVHAGTRDRQWRHAPEPSAIVSQGRDGNGGPGPTTDRRRKDQPARWLTASMLALGILATAAAVVSYSAQYRMVLAAKAVAPVAALEAAIPDVAALIFATLGIALALYGKRAIRARVLNVGAVATSITMNVLAAGHGWRDLAIWAMPPVAYALASDTAIGVVRAWSIARQEALNDALADEGATPLAILGGLLWVLRLAVAPASTLAGAAGAPRARQLPGHRSRQRPGRRSRPGR